MIEATPASYEQVLTGVILSKNYDPELQMKIFEEMLEKYAKIKSAIPVYLLKMCMFTDNRKFFSVLRQQKVDFNEK